MPALATANSCPAAWREGEEEEEEEGEPRNLPIKMKPGTCTSALIPRLFLVRS